MLERPADRLSETRLQDRERANSLRGDKQKNPANRPEKWPALKARAVEELHTFFRAQACAIHECEGSALEQISNAIDRAVSWATMNCDDPKGRRIMRELQRRDMRLPSRRTRYLWYDYAFHRFH